MSDLYKELGVPRTASKAEIRAAYRKASKGAHPDTGGTPGKFALVKRAHDVLTDEERRAKYDATGDESESAPDNGMSDIAQILAMALEQVLAQIEKRGGEPTEFDVLGDMKILMKQGLEGLEKQKLVFDKNKKKAEKMLGKFKTSKGPNILDGVFKQKVDIVNRDIRNLDKQLETAKKAYDVLKDYSFDFTPKQNNQYDAPHMQNLMNIAFQGRF